MTYAELIESKKAMTYYKFSAPRWELLCILATFDCVSPQYLTTRFHVGQHTIAKYIQTLAHFLSEYNIRVYRSVTIPITYSIMWKDRKQIIQLIQQGNENEL